MAFNQPQIGDEYSNTITSSKKGFNYLAGRSGDDLYIINDINSSWTLVDDSATLANEDDDREFLKNYYKDYIGKDNFTFVNQSEKTGSDTLQINNVNANDLYFFFDVYNGDEQGADIMDGLFICKKSAVSSVISQAKAMFSGKIPNSGAVQISAFFNDTTNGTNEIQKGENYINTIRTAFGNTTKTIDFEKYIKEVHDNVVEVLKKYNFTYAKDMLLSKYRNILLNCYKKPMDLTISAAGGKVYAEAGSDTISGYGTIYGTNNNDKLDLSIAADDSLIFSKSGNNLKISYYDSYYTTKYEIILANYYSSKLKNRLNIYVGKDGIEHLISDETINVIGKGKIYGTEGNDIVEGSYKNDIIYGLGGNDKLYGDWGNDRIYSQSKTGDTVLLAGEEGNDRLYAGKGNDIFYFGEALERGEGKDIIYNADSNDTLRFVNTSLEHLTFRKSGNNLIVTNSFLNNLDKNSDEYLAYKNFSATLSNFFKTNSKLNNLEFLSVSESGDITTDKKTLLNDAIINISGKKKIYDTIFNDYITGSKYNDTIFSNSGNDTITAGKGNDTIHLGKGEKTLNFSYGDGKDTVVISPETSEVKLNFKNSHTSSFTKSGNNLIITHFYLNSKGKLVSGGNVTLKNYFTNSCDIFMSNDGTNYTKFDIANEKINITGTYDKKFKETIFKGTKNNDIFFSASGTNVMYGGDGDDIYYVKLNKKTTTYISDNSPSGSDNDTLKIDANSDNIILLFNVNSDGEVCTYDANFAHSSYNADSLYIFDKSSLSLTNLMNFMRGKSFTGGIELVSYFEKAQNGEIFGKNKAGYIENIDIKNSNGSYESFDIEQKIQNISQSVASWINNHNYSSTTEVFANGNKNDISTLLYLYQQGSR